MKSITNLFLMIALMGTIALADGDMGNGNQTCTVDCPPPCTENCTGGQAAPGDDSNTGSLNATGSTSQDVIVVLVEEYVALGLSF